MYFSKSGNNVSLPFILLILKYIFIQNDNVINHADNTFNAFEYALKFTSTDNLLFLEPIMLCKNNLWLYDIYLNIKDNTDNIILPYNKILNYDTIKFGIALN